MSLENRVSGCLVSQEIRDLIKSGRIRINRLDESRIQPSSFEPVIGDEVFILDTENIGLFKPRNDESIYRTLIQIPGTYRKRLDISNGFELKKGLTYLIPLEESIEVESGEFIKSSPKSSFGRLFLNTRMLADYNLCFDEINPRYKANSHLKVWLMVQPLAFNIIVYPGVSFNQLRFFKGHNAQLNPAEIIDEIKKNPILFDKNSEALEPMECIVTDGLHIHLDTVGSHNAGVVALRAKNNLNPIDVSKKLEYKIEDYFEPLINKDAKGIKIKKGEYYLISSREKLKIPEHLNVELKGYSHIGISGPLHFAGFIDNGFEGDLTFEMRSDESSDVSLTEGMPISKLDIFRTNIPDKVYGKEIGSNYQEQVGPRPAKFFKDIDYEYLAKSYDKLNRLVLVNGSDILLRHRSKRDGFEFIDDKVMTALFEDIKDGFFHSRYDCEDDEAVLQIIPYILMFRGDRTIFSYVRASNIKDYGDPRLFDKHSIGVGGHISKEHDAKDGNRDYVNNCIMRELGEEVIINGKISTPKLIGTLMQYDKPVDRVHFGLVYAIYTDGCITPTEKSIKEGGMISIDKLVNDIKIIEKYETWSRVLVPHLHNIYNIIK
ncbi:MAG: 2'-deoxycytidine 5'-triphosphate deaminase [Nanoarchaeota archaeon]